MTATKKIIETPKSAAAASVSDTISTGQGKKPQTRASKEEADKRAASMTTQGRAGCKLPRINLSITPENDQFYKTMARLRGEAVTTYINDILTEYREAHQKAYDEAMDVLRKYKMLDS